MDDEDLEGEIDEALQDADDVRGELLSIVNRLSGLEFRYKHLEKSDLEDKLFSIRRTLEHIEEEVDDLLTSFNY